MDRKKNTAFNLNIGSGEIRPYIKLDGKDGTVSRSVYDGEERRMETVEDFNALFDFSTAQSGWMNFGGDVPDMRVAPITEPLPGRPNENFKQGIHMQVFLAKHGVHDLSTTAQGVIGALGKLYDEVKIAPETAKGLVPQVKIKHWVKEKTKKGTRAVPEFVIVGWRERPEALKNLAEEPKPRDPAPGSGETGTPPPTGSTALSKPAAPTSEAAEADDDDFG